MPLWDPVTSPTLPSPDPGGKEGCTPQFKAVEPDGVSANIGLVVASQAIFWTVIGSAGWLLWAALAHALLRNPRGDPGYGLGLGLVRLYCRLVHRLEVVGAQNIPAAVDGPLVVMVNHTAGVDPVLVQAALPFEVRWMMARDMMLPALDAWWRWIGVIPVERAGDGLAGSDPTAAREALRQLQAGAVVGVFPEGGIERPPRTLRPFMPGVGLLVKRAKAGVLPVIIEGTPVTDSAWGSLLRTSRSRVTILPVAAPPEGKCRAEDITRRLFDLYAATTGWPAPSAEQARDPRYAPA